MGSSEIHMQLIQEVKNLPILYDQSLRIYRKSAEKEKAWEEISQTLNKSGTGTPLTIHDCQVKWKSIRDRFVKEYNKLKEKDPTGSDESLTSQWPLYSELLFLLPSVKSRKKLESAKLFNGSSFQHSYVQTMEINNSSVTQDTYTVLLPTNGDHDYDSFDQSKAESSDLDISNASSKVELPVETQLVVVKTEGNVDTLPRENYVSDPSSLIHSPTDCKKRRLEMDEFEKALIASVVSKKASNEDESYYFAMSLIPMLRSLDEQQLCTAKIKIMTLLQEIKYSHEPQ